MLRALVDANRGYNNATAMKGPAPGISPKNAPLTMPIIAHNISASIIV